MPFSRSRSGPSCTGTSPPHTNQLARMEYRVGQGQPGSIHTPLSLWRCCWAVLTARSDNNATAHAQGLALLIYADKDHTYPILHEDNSHSAKSGRICFPQRRSHCPTAETEVSLMASLRLQPVGARPFFEETSTSRPGDDRVRTDDPLLAKQVLFQLSYVPAGASLVGQGGFEPPTPRLSSVCSNQLSY
jgi:hypothetical protein